MKKTISINISGFNFHIDEDAYDKLQRYLEAIRMHFRGIDSSEEVMSDIEYRVSEILRSKITETKQVLSIDDVDEVIGIMGQPSDFAPDEETTGTPGSSAYYRYSKRLYRDADNKVIGGVCSGIGAYFNLDPVWVRLIFVLMVFGSGFGILLYVILWLVVPEARTTAEKLEMRGQPVNIDTLERSFREEMGDFKERVHDMADKAKDTFKRGRDSFARRDRSYIKDNVHSVGNFFLRVLGVFTGVILFLFAVSLSLAFAFAIFQIPGYSIGNHTHFEFYPLFPFISTLFENSADLRTFSVGLLVLLGIPLLLLMLVGLRLIFNIPSFRYINGAAGWIWLLTLILTVYFGFKIAGSFRYEGESEKEQRIEIPAGDTLKLATFDNLPTYVHWQSRRVTHIDDLGMYYSDEDNMIYGIPKLRITTSPDSSIYLNERNYSRGISRLKAIELSESISYPWTIDSNTITFPMFFTIPKSDDWRKQEVYLDLKLPSGYIFKTDDKVANLFTRYYGMPRSKMSNAILMVTEEGVHQFVP